MNAIGKWMICVWLAVLCTTQTTANSTNPTNTHDTGVDEAHKSKARAIWQLISDGSRKIQYANNQDIVAVLGLSGVGKSTFVLFMTGNNTNLIARQVRNQRDKPIRNKYLIDDISKRIGMSNTKSFTELPEKLIDETTGTIYYDMPGFVDTRDAAQDIAGGYYIKRILDSAKSVKFVVMSSSNALQSGADKHAFMTVISHLAKLIRNIEKFQGGIALIATKVPNESDEEIKDSIVEYLEKVRDELTTNKYEDVFAKQLINILLETDSDGNYKFLHHMGRVRSEGPLSELQNMQENRVYLKKTVEKHLNYIPISKNDFDYTISDASKLYLNEVIENCYSEIEKRTSNLTQEINYYVYNSTKKMQNTLQSLTNYQIPDVEIVYKFKNKINQIEEGLKMLISRLESEVSEVLDPLQFSVIIDRISADFPFDLQPKFSAASSEIANQAHLLDFSKQFKINVTNNLQNNNNIIRLSHFKNTQSLLRQTTDNLTIQAESVITSCYSEIEKTTVHLTQDISNYVCNSTKKMQNTLQTLNHQIPDEEIVYKFKNEINQIEEGLKTLISGLESEIKDPLQFSVTIDQVSADFPFDLQPKFAAASSDIAIQAYWLDFSKQLKKNVNVTDNSQNNSNIILLSHFRNTLSLLRQTTDNLTIQAESVITSCYSEIEKTTVHLTQDISNYVCNSTKKMQNTLQTLNHQIPDGEIVYKFKNEINQIEEGLKTLISRLESEIKDPLQFSVTIDQVSADFPFDLQPKFAAASSDIAIQAHLLDFSKQLKINVNVTVNSQNNNNIILLSHFRNTLSLLRQTTDNLTTQVELVYSNCYSEIKETTSILTQEINNFVYNLAMNMQNTLQNLTHHQISEEIAYNYKNKINQIEDALKMLIGRIESEVNDPKKFSDVIDHVANSFPSDLQPKFTAASSEIAIQARLFDFARQFKMSVTENSENHNNTIWLHSFKKPLSSIKETTQNLTAQAEIVAKRIMQNIREQFQKSGTMLRHAYERKEADDSINIEDLYYEFNNISEILYFETIGMTSVADCVYNTLHLLHKANFSNVASLILPAMPLAHNFKFLQSFVNHTYNFDTCAADFSQAIEFFKNGRNFYKIIIDSKNYLLQFIAQEDTSTCSAYAIKYMQLTKRWRLDQSDILKKQVDRNCEIFASKCMGSALPYYFCDIITLGNTNVREAKLSAVFTYILDPHQVDIKCENNKLTAKGTNVKISEVVQNACWPTATEVIIFALETCFVDKDVDKSGMNATVTIIARVIEVVGWNRQINLSGPDGARHVPSKAENGNVTYVSGAPGKAGNAGGPGGDCLLIAERITNGDVLTINVQGGRGGPGQDGGDGYASDCVYRTPPSILYDNKMSNWQHLFHFKRINESSLCPGICFLEQYEVRLEPTEGGSGGDGGYGGEGGPSGIGVIVLLNSEKSAKENGSHWSTITDGSRRNGADGIPGIGGAGENGAIIDVYEEWHGFSFFKNEVTIENQGKCYVGNNGKILKPTVSPSLADPRTAHDLIHRNQMLQSVTYQYNLFALSRPSPIARILNVNKLKKEVTGLEWKDSWIIGEFMAIENLKYNNVLDHVTNKVYLSLYNSLLERTQLLSSLYDELISKNEINADILEDNIFKNNFLQFAIKTCLNKNNNEYVVVDIYKYLNLAANTVNEYLNLAEHRMQEYSNHVRNMKIDSNRKRFTELITSQVRDAQRLIDGNVFKDIKMLQSDLEVEIGEVITDANIQKSEAQMYVSDLQKAKTRIANKIPSDFTLGLIQLAGLFVDTSSFYSSELTKAITADSKPQFLALTTKMKQISDYYLNKKNILKYNLEQASSYGRDILDPEDYDRFENVTKSLRKLVYSQSVTPSELIKEKTTTEKELSALLENVNRMSEPQRRQRSVNGTRKMKWKSVGGVFQLGLKAGGKVFDMITGISGKKDEFASTLSSYDEAISQGVEHLNALERYENVIHTALIPMKESVDKFTNDAITSSQTLKYAQLQINAWNIQKVFADFETDVDNIVMVSNPIIKANLKNCIGKIKAGLYTVNKIYEGIQSLKRDIDMANYIADLQMYTKWSNHRDLDEVGFYVSANMILAEFKNIQSSFQQIIFPFAPLYTPDDFNLLSGVRKKNLTDVVQIAIQQINYYKEQLTIANSVVKYSNYAIFENIAFDISPNPISMDPFYVWDGIHYKNEIKQLLEGATVAFQSDIRMSLPLTAIKFNQIGISFASKNETLQARINATLAGFLVKMVHFGDSHFKCINQTYIFNHSRFSLNHAVVPVRDEKGVHYEHLSSNSKILRDNAAFVSPYASWLLRLSRKNGTVGEFTELQEFVDADLDLVLEGRGQYVADAHDICNADLATYYQLVND